jgi:protein tyrosine phosphatase (PTP) superfamily phosphohydrolase (DUF442 family)
MFTKRCIVILLVLSTVAMARSQRSRRSVDVVPERSIRGEPQSAVDPYVDARMQARWDAIEEEDTRVGNEADRVRGVKRFPDIEVANLSRDGNIWIGGEPTLRGYRQLRDRGVRAIVDLRNPTAKQRESEREARRLGMAYMLLPVSPKNMTDDDAEWFLAFMKNHEKDQVLIHCGSANRASAMYAVYLGMARGMSPDGAIRRARLTGLKERELENDVRAFLERNRDRARTAHAD